MLALQLTSFHAHSKYFNGIATWQIKLNKVDATSEGLSLSALSFLLHFNPSPPRRTQGLLREFFARFSRRKSV
jgi:hypothetical protein